MSDDLVRRARSWDQCWPSRDIQTLVPEMADRIEELKDKLNYAVGEWRDYEKTIKQMKAEGLANRAAILRLEAKLEKAVALLGQWRLASAGHVSVRSVIDKHDATLAELKGQGDE